MLFFKKSVNSTKEDLQQDSAEVSVKEYKEFVTRGFEYDIWARPFHSSWNMLMPVIEKIETIQLPAPSMTPVSVSIKGNSCRIFKGEWNEGAEGFISHVSYEGNKKQYTKNL